MFDENLAALEAVDFESLDQDSRIDWLLFRNHLQFEGRQLEYASRKTAEISELLPFAGTIIELEENRRLLKPQDPRESAALVAGIAGQIKAVRATLAQQIKEKTVPSAVDGRRAAMAVDDLRRRIYPSQAPLVN